MRVSLNKDNEYIIYEETINNFIHVIAKNMNLYGITPSIGRLYGTLFFSEEPMSLDDLRDSLGMSKTSMSTGVRKLAEIRMVETAFRKGVRKDLYTSEEDWYKSFTSLFEESWLKQTQSNIEEAESTIKKLTALKEETEDENLVIKISGDIERLHYANNYYKWLVRFIDVVASGEIFNYVKKEE